MYICTYSPEAAVKIIKTDRMMTIVTERLMESLAVMSHYMGWSLADVVVTGEFNYINIYICIYTYLYIYK
jgi:hypothetical protein